MEFHKIFEKKLWGIEVFQESAGIWGRMDPYLYLEL